MTKARPAPDRFYEKIDRIGTVPADRPELGPCWLWTGQLLKGYGHFYDGGTRSAHRWSYEHFVGPVPAGLELDHLCRVRRCVNPAHLEAVTHVENVIRSPLANANKTHCVRGHEYSVENTHWKTTGGRRCRICVRDETRLRARARRATGRR